VPTLRLLSYNVRSMRDDRAALGRVISAAEPDVACIQEAPRFLRWRSLCGQLARTSGLVVVSGGRPAAANLILSNLAVDVVTTVDVLLTRDGRLHQRGTAIAVLRYAGSTFAVAGTHLDVAPAPRLRHVTELHAAIAAHVPRDVPSVIAGDINERPGSPAWQALSGLRQDAHAVAGTGDGFTSEATNPRQRIDGVFVDPRITVRSCTVIDSDDTRIASDHLPILVELDL
jgi:endonuclease/exonuclease/phosphatase family metal-dependent hydrolase